MAVRARDRLSAQYRQALPAGRSGDALRTAAAAVDADRAVQAEPSGTDRGTPAATDSGSCNAARDSRAGVPVNSSSSRCSSTRTRCGSRAGDALRDPVWRADAGERHRGSPRPRPAAGVRGHPWRQPCGLRALPPGSLPILCAPGCARRSAFSARVPRHGLLDSAKTVIVARGAYGDGR